MIEKIGIEVRFEEGETEEDVIKRIFAEMEKNGISVESNREYLNARIGEMMKNA